MRQQLGEGPKELEQAARQALLDFGTLLTMPCAMVLSAGLGKRLEPLTLERPKALVPMGDTTCLQHILRQLKASGITHAIVNTYGQAAAFVAELSQAPLPVELLEEPELLGTAGALHHARERIGSEPVLVHNADVLVEVPVAELFSTLKEAPMALLVAKSAGSGTVALGPEGAVVGLRGRSFGKVARFGNYTGVMVLAQGVAEALPPRGCLIGDVALPLLAAGRRLEALEVEVRFRDIGSPAEYLAGNLDWLEAQRKRGALIGESWVGEGVRIEAGVELQRCVLGTGAEVLGTGLLERVVAWPGARVRAPLSDAVVTSWGRVVEVAALAQGSAWEES